MSGILEASAVDDDDNPFSFSSFASGGSGSNKPKKSKGKSKTGSKPKTKRASATEATTTPLATTDSTLLDDPDDAPFPDILGGGQSSNGENASTSASSKKPKARRKTKGVGDNPLNPMADLAGADADEGDNPFSLKSFLSQPATPAKLPTEKPAAAVAKTKAAKQPKSEASHATKVDSSGSDNVDEVDEANNPFSFSKFISSSQKDLEPASAETVKVEGVSNDDGGSPLDLLPDVFEAPQVTMTPGKSAAANRVKRKLSDLQEKLAMKTQELEAIQEHSNTTFQRLKDENSDLTKELAQVREALAKAEQREKTLKRQLKAKQSSEEAEAAALEDMAERVEQNLQQALSRAATAEARAASLEKQLIQIRGKPLEPSDLDVIKSASAQLDAAALRAKDSIRTLLEGAGNLQMISDLLMSVAQIGPFDPSNQQKPP